MQIQITGCMFENMGRNMNTKSKVIVLPCEAYDEERIYTLMKNGLSQLGGLDNLINKEEKILLKPNLLKKAEVEKAVITHPAHPHGGGRRQDSFSCCLRTSSTTFLSRSVCVSKEQLRLESPPRY